MLSNIVASPQKISAAMRAVAAKLEASKNPSVTLVQRDLRLINAMLTREARVRQIAAEMIRLAEDDLEVSLWDTDEGKDLESAMKFTRNQDTVDKLVPALRSLKHDVDGFIEELRREGPKASPPSDEEQGVTTSAPPRPGAR